MVRALTLDLIALWIVAIFVLWALERLAGPDGSSRLRMAVWALWLGLLSARALGGLIVAQLLSWQQLSAGRAFVATAGVLLLLWLFSSKAYGAAVGGLRLVVLLLGCSMFWALPALAYAGFARQPHDAASFERPTVAAASPHRRIVWLLFDELSYDQVFDHRWPGLNLPNFDRLRSESVTFADMQPDGYFTERIIPSLLLGKPIVEARSTEAGGLLYRSTNKGAWENFDENATLFAEARKAGWSTGVSGDYNPYCRMLANELDWCAMRLIVFGDHLSRDKSTWANFTAPAQAAWSRAAHRAFEPAPSEDALFGEAIDSVRQLITSEKIDFVFGHIYLPHPPGIYDRKASEVRRGGSYIDNLALSDRVLGELVQALEEMPSAGQTTLIVSSDHSWRVGIWRDGFGWTREDELASGHGHFDPRPFLMVHFPGETGSETVSQPVPLLAMHAMMERMLRGQIVDREQLKAWSAQR